MGNGETIGSHARLSKDPAFTWVPGLGMMMTEFDCAVPATDATGPAEWIRVVAAAPIALGLRELAGVKRSAARLRKLLEKG